jgi:hypothetical protein
MVEASSCAAKLCVTTPSPATHEVSRIAIRVSRLAKEVRQEPGRRASDGLQRDVSGSLQGPETGRKNLNGHKV